MQRLRGVANTMHSAKGESIVDASYVNVSSGESVLTGWLF
jgi:hypothetical protein